MNLKLDGRNAIITGASKGIGAACAHRLASEGCNLVLVSRRAEDLADVEASLPMADGRRVISVPADLTVAGSADRIVEQALGTFSRIDVLVNCAGAAHGGEFLELTEADWRDSFELKFFATVWLLKAVVRAMTQSGGGRIVTVVGNSGRQPLAEMLPGASANAALLAVTKGLADAVADRNVVVNAINPGPTRTERWTTLMGRIAESRNTDPASVEDSIIEHIPMGKLASPEQISGLVAFLCSEAAAHMTGTSLTADGGWTRGLA